MQFTVKRFEDASIAYRRTLERVERVLAGQDLDLIGTICCDIMSRVVQLEGGPERDLDRMDACVDRLAAALRQAVHDQLEREQAEMN